MFDVHQFLFRSDWTLAASGGAHMKPDSEICAIPCLSGVSAYRNSLKLYKKISH